MREGVRIFSRAHSNFCQRGGSAAVRDVFEREYEALGSMRFVIYLYPLKNTYLPMFVLNP